jgi:hypothetical protein
MTKQPAGRFAGISMNPRGVSGLQSRRLQNLRAGRFGAANRGRRLNADECRTLENQMRQEGKIS